MGADLYVAGTPTAVPGRRGTADSDRVVGRAHAVSRPVVDGLAASECGLLVTAVADLAWHRIGEDARCPECSRIAG
ncbi:hypothetical protein [Blastococcus sp. TF02A-26]|uniref:hypothetical protein n=1 Tax=Blastococcus sp. TF02A-26 TaxID=2250577 RepID=UPI000DE9183A|nr:hypothetical protein [Blastococcus sp. TF02A-26]RBY85851.1 hypothetical protein DQ240_10680 [Blastococcus sp. TF02A-26]